MGTNDFFGENPAPEPFFDAYHALLDDVRATFPDVPLFILVPLLDDGWPAGQQQQTTAERLTVLPPAGMTPETMPATDAYLGLRAFADELARCGLEHACTSPGSRSTPIVLSLVRNERIRCWSHLDERCAGFFALGAAKASNRPTAVTCTSGTAAANLTPAVVEAHEARVPLIVLTVFLVSFALTALGFAIAWPMDSTSAFHAIINLFLIPLCCFPERCSRFREPLAG